MAVAVVLAAQTAVRAAPLVLEGEVPEAGDFFLLDFEVPEGTVEVEVRHDDLSDANILDWGLEDPNGFRGWGGGNAEPAVVGASAASRSYLAGPIPSGTWKVVVGKAQIKERPAKYRVEVKLRQVATLAAQPERATYAPHPALSTARRFYAGDFHVHSKESGDARPELGDIAGFARSRGLDFVAVSDHNTTAQNDFFAAAQADHPQLLLVPSVEYTTYRGHMNAFGATEYVDHRLGLAGMTLAKALEQFAAQGAVVTINHPTLDIGTGCIGCAWEHQVPRAGIGAIEIGVGGWDTTGALFDESAIAFWDRLSDLGIHLAAVGGSDDHRAGVNLNQTQSPIGDPTTLVLADELSVAALVDGVRSGRTVVKLRGPSDGMVTIDADGERHGDTVVTSSTTLRVEVQGGLGKSVRLVHDGLPEAPVHVDADPFVLEHEVDVPELGETRWRAEVLEGGKPRTVTSHVWLARSWPPSGAEPVVRQRELPQSCGVAGGAAAAVLGVIGALVVLRSRPGVRDRATADDR